MISVRLVGGKKVTCSLMNMKMMKEIISSDLCNSVTVEKGSVGGRRKQLSEKMRTVVLLQCI